jgi:hypothetical protein
VQHGTGTLHTNENSNGWDVLVNNQDRRDWQCLLKKNHIVKQTTIMMTPTTPLILRAGPRVIDQSTILSC